MALSLLQIWLLGCFANHAFSSEINRRDNYDIVTPNGCVSCENLNGNCVKSQKQRPKCCTRCECKKRGYSTFYQSNATQVCVANPNDGDKCKYYIGNDFKKILAVKLDKSKDTKLGKLNHKEMKLASFDCTVKNSQYWNLLKWEDFNNQQRFQIETKIDHYLKIKKNAASIVGYLVKLRIECNYLKSCVIFKILGKREYAADVVTRVQTTTKKPTLLPTKLPTTQVTTHLPAQKKKTSDILIFVIIGVSLAIFLVILAIVICWIWKRRRKSKKGRHGETVLLRNGEDPTYQNNDRFSTRHSTEIHNSTNNLTYLQAIDAGIGRKDPNYDYPDVNRFSKRGNYEVQPAGCSGETPIYADPENIVKPRSDTEVVGVPGYQPPRGPFSDDAKSTYSSLDVTSVGDGSVYQALLGADESEKASKPAAPQYAIVEPEEEGGEITV